MTQPTINDMDKLQIKFCCVKCCKAGMNNYDAIAIVNGNSLCMKHLREEIQR